MNTDSITALVQEYSRLSSVFVLCVAYGIILLPSAFFYLHKYASSVAKQAQVRLLQHNHNTPVTPHPSERKDATEKPEKTQDLVQVAKIKHKRAIRLFLLLSLNALNLCGTTERLLAILALLALLPASLLDFGGQADANQAVVRLELLHSLRAVVDQSKAGCLAATKLCPQTKNIDLVFGGLVEGSQLVAELVLCDVGTTGV